MITNLSLEYSSWKTEYTIIQKKHESLSVFEKIKCYFGFYKIEGKEEIKGKLKDIYRESVKKVSLVDLHEFFDINNSKGVCHQEDPLTKIFARKVAKFHFSEIQNKEKFVGFTWKITNNNTNVTHYVEGTTHAATKNMIDDPYLKEAIENTKLLITELEGNRIIFFLRWLERLMTGSATNYCIDDEMIKQAMEKNSNNIGLETFWEQLVMPSTVRQAQMNCSIPKIFRFIPMFFRIFKIIRFQTQISNHIAAGFWQKGELPPMNIPDVLLKDRNFRWLYDVSLKDCKNQEYKGIIDLLKKTETPTCIAVGAAHCIGKINSLPIIDVLQKTGYFTIERLGNA